MHRTPRTLRLRIATWNIHKGVRGIGPRKRLEIHNIKQALADLDADLVCLQEIRQFNHREAARFAHWPDSPQTEFLAPAGYHWAYRSNALTQHGEHGNALISRFPIASCSHENMSDHRFEQRGLLHATVSTPTGPLHVIVVHLGLIAASRQRQMAQLSSYIHREIPALDPLVIAGDFNAPMAPVRWAQAALGPQSDPVRTKHSGPWHALGGQATFPSAMPLVQLDHVLVRHASIAASHVPRDAAWARLSDHLPLLVEVDI